MISWLIIYYYSFFNYQLSFLFPQNQVPNPPHLFQTCNGQDLDLDQLGGWVQDFHMAISRNMWKQLRFLNVFEASIFGVPHFQKNMEKPVSYPPGIWDQTGWNPDRMEAACTSRIPFDNGTDQPKTIVRSALDDFVGHLDRFSTHAKTTNPHMCECLCVIY